MIDVSDILQARERITPWVRPTPMMRMAHIQSPTASGIPVFLKLECLQVTGSFKARGAMNAVLAADRGRYAEGIVTASGGNHGLAVARTAYVMEVPATIFVPAGVSPAKIGKMKSWNAQVHVVGSLWDESNAAALDCARSTGAYYLHSFADPLIVAGQGTLALDILDDLPELDTIVIAIGGGGLIAGMATAIRSLCPSARIIGVEPVGSPTLKASIDAGQCVTLTDITTRVPTMACRRTDPGILDIVSRSVDDVVLVSDEEMQEASQWLWFEMGVAADLSGAAALAALRHGISRIKDARNVCALVCGAGAEGTG